MLSKSTLLLHYKRKEIAEAMVEHGQDREVAVKYGEKGFGKRPGILAYPNDVLAPVMQGATSFHASEERWINPLQLQPSLPRKELQELRSGWDLVLDIDCPVWEIARVITHELVQELYAHGVKQVSCKFSGNKGFHIGVPAEAFPGKVSSKLIAEMFPDAPRKIATFLVDSIASRVSEKITKKKSLHEVVRQLGVKVSEVFMQKCGACGETFHGQADVVEWVCRVCGDTKRTEQVAQCERHGFMERVTSVQACPACKKTKIIPHLEIAQLLSVDTILISSRHLYRMPYSLHEKSGLCSVPIDPHAVLEFEREQADPKLVQVKHGFLERGDTTPSGRNLLVQALDYKPKLEDPRGEEKVYEVLTEKIPEEFFPPCMQLMKQGISDGKKRALFSMVNFLSSLNWTWEDIQAYLQEWNRENPEPLREVNIEGQVRYHKQHKKKILPPNCDNKMYYVDIGVCKPDSLCRKIKNPVNYAVVKAKIVQEQSKSGK